jgi:hypothetical protein
MRNLDSPSDEEVAEYVDELLKKRLGLSETVAAQIARYEAVVRRGDPVSSGELEQILRLASRRTDAALVFADAGRRAARRAVARLSLLTRWGSRYLPGPVRRAVGFVACRRAAARVFGARMRRDGSVPLATLDPDTPVRATADGASCAFYGAALAELLRQLVEFDGAMVHSRCRARGDGACEFRASSHGERV